MGRFYPFLALAPVHPLWFGDSCGGRVIMTRGEVVAHLENLADYINNIQPDILLLQEVDVESKRSGYVDQVQWQLQQS